jgi:hypothetical protein
MTTALEGDESASRPGRSLPPGKIRYPLYRRLGGPQGRSGQVRKISPPPGFDSRTVQLVASRYTDHATRSTNITNVQVLILKLMIVGVRGGGLPRTIFVCLLNLSGTALQFGRLRVRFAMVSLEFFIDIILPAALWPWG